MENAQEGCIQWYKCIKIFYKKLLILVAVMISTVKTWHRPIKGENWISSKQDFETSRNTPSMSTSGLCFSLLTLPIELYQYQFLHKDLHNSIVKVVEVEKNLRSIIMMAKPWKRRIQYKMKYASSSLQQIKDLYSQEPECEKDLWKSLELTINISEW